LIAPRPLLIESGDQDDLFPATAAAEEVAKLRTVYGALGAGDDQLVHDIFPAGHQWHGEQAYPFLERCL
jgi:hypothetical protein